MGGDFVKTLLGVGGGLVATVTEDVVVDCGYHLSPLSWAA